MLQQKSSLREVFKEDTEKLFKRMLVLANVVCLLALLLQFLGGNYGEMLFGLSFQVLLGINLLLFCFNQKVFAYHSIVIGLCFLYLYQIVIGGARYEAVLLFYPSALLYCFIFFDNIKTLYFYLLFLLGNQLIILYFNSGANENGFTFQLFVEYLNVISFGILTFLSAAYYLNNLKRTKIKLDETIDEISLQETILKDKNKELARYFESNKQLENYAHLAAHELKAPLRSIQGFAKLLKRKVDPKLDDQEKELFDFISENSLKMGNLLDELNKLGKVSKTELKLAPFDFEELIDEIKMDRRYTIEEKNAIVEYVGEVKEITGQRSLLKQLFSNLIGNGLKFVEKDIQPIVRVDAEYRNNAQYFKIMDNGIGIDPEFRDKIFQIFTRLNSNAQFEGSGLGLAIGKKIVDMHKGTIMVGDSDLGGACFEIRLPILLEKVAAEPDKMESKVPVE